MRGGHLTATLNQDAMNYAMLHHGAVMPHHELRDHEGHKPVDAHLGLHNVQAVPLHRGNL